MPEKIVPNVQAMDRVYLSQRYVSFFYLCCIYSLDSRNEAIGLIWTPFQGSYYAGAQGMNFLIFIEEGGINAICHKWESGLIQEVGMHESNLNG